MKGRPVKLLFPLLNVAAMIGLAVPAHADSDATDAPGVEVASLTANTDFIESLRAAGIGYRSEDQAISAGQAMCGLIERGQGGLQVIGEIQANNPGISIESAAHFAKIAAASYCPQQLVPAGGNTK